MNQFKNTYEFILEDKIKEKERIYATKYLKKDRELILETNV